MPLVREDDGTWRIEVDDQDRERVARWSPSYVEAVPRYLNAFDPLFSRARARCEFQFLLSLFRVRGLQDPGYDPYETTLRAIPEVAKAAKAIEDFDVRRHLQLWIYGHAVEASEPYELLANLMDVANGGQFLSDRFPPRRRKPKQGKVKPARPVTAPSDARPQSPGEKISALVAIATSINLPQALVPLQEAWDRDLRNAVFHADYTLFGTEVRLARGSGRVYSHQQITTLVDRALVYQEALATLYRYHLDSYTEPTEILTDPGFSHGQPERALVIVRAKHGAVGVRAAEPGRGAWLLGRFLPGDDRLLDENPRQILPALDDAKG